MGMGGGSQWQQEAFRIRNDDGSQTAASWMYTLNTDGDVDMDTIFRVRFLIDEYNNRSETEGFRIQYCVNGGSYYSVTSSSSCQYANSSYVTDGENTTQQISSGYFSPGNVCEDGVTQAQYVSSNNYTEHEFVLLLDSGQLNDGDIVTLRLILDGGSTLDSYLQYPDLTCREPSAEGNLMLSFHF